MKLSAFTSDYGRRHRLMSILLGLLMGALTSLVYGFERTAPGKQSFFSQVDDLVYDWWLSRRNQRLLSAREVGKWLAERLVIVKVDDRTMREMDLQWPFPRDLYGELVRRLKLAGARTVALDILFVDRGADPARDRVLAEALKDPAVVVPYQLVSREGGTVEKVFLHPTLAEGWTEADYRRRTGYTADWRPKGEEVTRRAFLEIDPYEGRERHYAFAVAVLAHYLGKTPEVILSGLAGLEHRKDSRFSAVLARVNYLGLGGDAPPSTQGLLSPEELPGEGEIALIQGPAQGPVALEPGIEHVLPVYSMVDLFELDGQPLSDEELDGYFGFEVDPATGEPVLDPETGRPRPRPVIALVGVTMTAGHDLKLTPVGWMAGLHIHANILANILQDNFLRTAPGWRGPALIVLTAVIASLLLPFLEFRTATALCLLAAAGLCSWEHREFAGGGYREAGVIHPLSGPLLSLVLSYTGVLAYLLFAERQARESLSRTLREVCPLPDLEGILTGQGIELGGQERELTILFSDIRGYTDLSETMSPVQVKERLNQYFGAVSEILERYGGVIFDYQGDAQMVVFGLKPESQPNHALAACKAGVAMIRKLQEIREEWRKAGEPLLETGIGICSGAVSLGFLGTAQHKQYAAIGDATNTAARLQGKSRELDAPVLITRSTFEAAGPDLVAEPLPPLKVKGKREPLQVYRVRIQETREKKGVHA